MRFGGGVRTRPGLVKTQACRWACDVAACGVLLRRAISPQVVSDCSRIARLPLACREYLDDVAAGYGAARWIAGPRRLTERLERFDAYRTARESGLATTAAVAAARQQLAERHAAMAAASGDKSA
jgi:hypothetical protein